jgi:hypothetical protein
MHTHTLAHTRVHTLVDVFRCNDYLFRWCPWSCPRRTARPMTPCTHWVNCDCFNYKRGGGQADHVYMGGCVSHFSDVHHLCNYNHIYPLTPHPNHLHLLTPARGLFSLAADGHGSGSGSGSGSYAHIFSILTRLRLLCLHPSLVPAELIEKVGFYRHNLLLQQLIEITTRQLNHNNTYQVKRLARLAASASAAASSSGGGAMAMDPQAAMAKALGELGKDGVDKLLKALAAKQGESEDWWVGGVMGGWMDGVDGCGCVFGGALRARLFLVGFTQLTHPTTQHTHTQPTQQLHLPGGAGAGGRHHPLPPCLPPRVRACVSTQPSIDRHRLDSTRTSKAARTILLLRSIKHVCTQPNQFTIPAHSIPPAACSAPWYRRTHAPPTTPAPPAPAPTVRASADICLLGFALLVFSLGSFFKMT